MRRQIGVALLLVGLTAQAALAEYGGLAIGGRSGTLGLGGELAANVLPDLNGRFGVTFFDLSLNGTFSGVEYDFDLDMLTYPITVDWYPFQNAFHVSAGIIINETDVDLGARPDTTITIGDTTYLASEVGTLSGDVSYRRVAPYIGIGWGNAFGKEKRWGVVGDFGIAFIGSPDVSLSASGPIASQPAFQSDLAQEQDDLEDDLSDFNIYPVFSVSFFFRF
jgi:hypothetical protein